MSNESLQVESGNSNRNVNRRKWAVVVALTVVVAGTLLLRQQPSKASEIAAQASKKRDSVSSYHIKSKTTLFQTEGKEYVAVSENWYKAPDKTKSVITQPGSKTTHIMDGNTRWSYTEAEGIAFITPVSDKELESDRTAGRITPEMIKKYNYKYAGVDRVGGRVCDVMEGEFFGGVHKRICIDRSTGVMLQYVSTEKGKIVDRNDVEILTVNESIPDDSFKLQLPPDVLLVKTPVMTSELFNINLNPDSKSINSTGQVREPYEVTGELGLLAEQEKLFTPDYIPIGYKLAGVGSQGERRNAPDGSFTINSERGFNTVHIEYVHPKTGDTIIIMERAKRFSEAEGRSESVAGFQGRVETHKEPFPYINLYWQRDGVYFMLSASSMEVQEAVKIAQAMRPFVASTAR